MIKVIKKDGRIEDFNDSKVMRSITNSADRVKIQFNKSDLDTICMDVEKKIKEIRKDGSPTSTYEVRSLVVELLIDIGFSKVANSYVEGRMLK